MPTVQTVAVRMPATMTGRANGNSTIHKRCPVDMPTPFAASTAAGGTCRRPVNVFSTMGSKA